MADYKRAVFWKVATQRFHEGFIREKMTELIFDKMSQFDKMSKFASRYIKFFIKHGIEAK